MEKQTKFVDIQEEGRLFKDAINELAILHIGVSDCTLKVANHLHYNRGEAIQFTCGYAAGVKKSLKILKQFAKAQEVKDSG